MRSRRKIKASPGDYQEAVVPAPHAVTAGATPALGSTRQAPQVWDLARIRAEEQTGTAHWFSVIFCVPSLLCFARFTPAPLSCVLLLLLCFLFFSFATTARHVSLTCLFDVSVFLRSAAGMKVFKRHKNSLSHKFINKSPQVPAMQNPQSNLQGLKSERVHPFTLSLR